MIEASVVLATYNKNKYLPNVLVSLARQRTSFRFEVCIVDDLSDNDPGPTIKKILPDAKYRRLRKKAGDRMATLVAANMVAPTSRVIVLSSADVIYVQSFVVEEMVRRAKSLTYTTAEVINVPVNPRMYRNYSESKLLKIWDRLPKDGNPSKLFYAGSRRPGRHRYQFLWSIMRKDLDRMVRKDGAGVFCDGFGAKIMKEMGFRTQFLDHLKGIHQTHPRGLAYPCPIFETCRFNYRCLNRRGPLRDFAKIYGANRTVGVNRV